MAVNPLPRANLEASRALVRALASAGVRHACVTPGSRSTPLAFALASQSDVRPWIHLDERSSAYFGLGLARATGSPVMLVCTSGTAAANFYPAVAEASLSRVPLVVCTADRPPRLRDNGAAQAIIQPSMFGPHARWAADLSAPGGQDGELRQFANAGLRAARLSMAPLAGPVHLNLPFEEPLGAIALDPELPGASLGAEAGAGPPGPDSVLAPPMPGPAPAALDRAPAALALWAPGPVPADLDRALAALASRRRPLIVAGPESGGLPADAIAHLAECLGAPVLADPLSGLRFGPAAANAAGQVIDAFDALLRDPRAAPLAPDAVLWFGGPLTSKAANQFLAAVPGAAHVLFEAWGGWRDPDAAAQVVVAGDTGAACRYLSERVAPRGAEAGWCDRWLDLNARARAAMLGAAAAFEEPFEGRVFSELQALLPDGATIFAGNSMPVRDADSFLAACSRGLSVVANRGANGIDGVVSSALGAAAAGIGPVVLVIGDLSFYHDLNGLWAAARHRLDLTVVLINNDGGGIFHYLPQVADEQHFEEWFGTPHGLDFAGAVRMYGGSHVVAQDWAGFRRAVAPLRAGLNVVELRTDRRANTAMHRQAWRAAAEAAFAGPGK